MANSSNRRHWGRVVRYFAYFTAAFLVVVAAAAYFLPDFLDSPAVRSQIQQKLSQAVGGEVTWEKLDLRILPLPGGVLHRARVEIPGITHARAERMEVRLQLRPLLRGQVEITDIHVARPEIRVDITSLLQERDATTGDPFTAYRKGMQAVVDVVRKIAPDAALVMEKGFVEVRATDMPPLELRELSIRLNTDSRGMEVAATMAGNHWERMQLSAHIDYSDLSAKASLDAGNMRPQVWLDRYLAKWPVRAALPTASLRVQASTDGKAVLNGDFTVDADKVEVLHGSERASVAGVGLKGKVSASLQEISLDLDEIKLDASRLRQAKLRYQTKGGALKADAGFDLDLAQGMDYARRFAPAEAGAALARVKQVSGRAQGHAQLASGHSGWHVAVDILKSDASVQLLDLADPVHIAGGVFNINARTAKAERVSLSMAAGQALAAAHYSMADRALTGDADFEVDVARVLRMVLGLLPAKDREALAAIQSINGRAKGKAKFSLARGTWHASADVQDSSVSAEVRDLPGPVRFAGGLVEINPKSIKINRAALTMSGSRLSVSATVDDHLTDRPQLTASVSEGLISEESLAWIWKIAGLPLNLAVKAPVSISAKRIAWQPKKMFDVSVSARFGTGPEVTVDGGWTPGVLNVRRATLKDEHSDAVVALRSKDRTLEGRFSGALQSTSIPGILRNAQVLTGSVNGDLRFQIDRDHPARTTVEGNLKGESIDLAWLIKRPAKINRIDLETDKTTLHIREAAVDWAGQQATMSGQISRGAKGPVVDLQLDSPGIDLDKLLPAGSEAPAPGRQGQKRDVAREVSGLWPLPLTGRVAIRADSLRHGRFTIAPLAASAVLQEHKVRLDLTQAQMCGISLPLTVETSPQGVVASAKITAQSQQLDQTARCLTDSRVSIDGVFDLKADISTRGRLADLKRNLQGTVSGEMRDGRVKKFALLGNILSLTNVAALFKAGLPKLDDEGFPYRALTVNGHFEQERFIVEEGAFRSDAVGLVAKGWISVLDYESRLSVLVAPFSRVDEIVRKVPVLGYILGGSLTSVPVGVSGDIRDPVVVPLGPGAVTSELLGIFERTLKLPGKLVVPFKEDRGTDPSPNP